MSTPQPTPQPTPEELIEWVSERVRILEERTRAARRGARVIADREQFVLQLLDALADVQAVSERMVHLLTAYALRERVATQTQVAKASKVTITGAAGRAAGKVAQAAWDEVWTRPKSTPPAGI